MALQNASHWGKSARQGRHRGADFPITIGFEFAYRNSTAECSRLPHFLAESCIATAALPSLWHLENCLELQAIFLVEGNQCVEDTLTDIWLKCVFVVNDLTDAKPCVPKLPEAGKHERKR